MEKQTELFNTAETSIPKGALDGGSQSSHNIWPLERKVTLCKLENCSAPDICNHFRAGTDLGRGRDEGQASVMPEVVIIS